ncbi:unnamed protein product, partial [marine sediment metagenome]
MEIYPDFHYNNSPSPVQYLYGDSNYDGEIPITGANYYGEIKRDDLSRAIL